MTVYTETVIHGATPYQIAIVEIAEGVRVTGRIEGERVVIGDNLEEIETVDQVRRFRKK
jgi:hypothetical protein